MLCQDRADISSDLKGFLTISYKIDEVEYIANDIEHHLNRVQEAVIQSHELALTRVTYFGKRVDAQIHERIRNAKERIDILQTNLAIIHTDYMADIIRTMQDNPKLKLRILTLDPQSIFVNFRGQQLKFGESISLYRGELESNLRSVHFSLRPFGDRVQLKIYDDFPTQIAFFFDKEVLDCVVSATGRSRENCAFLLDFSMPGVQKSFIDHFNYLWEEKSVTYSPA